MKINKFDYTNESPSKYRYYGFHLINGRYLIDLNRLKNIQIDGYFDEKIFSMGDNNNFFKPKKRKHSDYAINILIDKLNLMSSDWKYEYKDIIRKIPKSKQVEKNYRDNEIAYCSNADDLDEIEIEARFRGALRSFKDGEIIKSIHLQYIQKIFTEYFRHILLVIKSRGFGNNYDFKYGDLVSYIQERFPDDIDTPNPLYSLPHYKYFDVLNKIDNFLKHNTLKSYNSLFNNPKEKNEELKVFQSSFVYSNKEMGRNYENGMYAGDWLKINPNYIEETLSNLKEFSKELCQLLYNEDPNEALWNSDEDLLKIVDENLIDIL